MVPIVGNDPQRLTLITRQAGSARATDRSGPLLPPRAQLTGTARRLQEAALVLFGQRGYDAVSVRDIAAEIGVKASSLYAHVPSKQRILVDLVRLGHEEHRDALRAALLEAGSGPEEQLAALTRAHVLVHTAYPLLTRVCNRELGSVEEAYRTEILAVRVDSERLLFDVIERGQRLGTFGPVDAVLSVAAIGAMGIRVADWWQADLGVSAQELADTYADFALRIVAA